MLILEEQGKVTKEGDGNWRLVTLEQVEILGVINRDWGSLQFLCLFFIRGSVKNWRLFSKNQKIGPKITRNTFYYIDGNGRKSWIGFKECK